VAAAPRNAAYARKLRVAAEGGQRARSARERREQRTAQRQRAVEALNARHDLAPYGVVLALAWLAALVGWAGWRPGPELGAWLPLPLHTAIAAGLGGVLAGLALSLAGLPSSRREDLATRPPAWVVLALTLLSLLLFYLSAVCYCVWSLVRRRLSPSLSMAYIATGALVVALAASAAWGGGATVAADWQTVALFSGNLALPCLLLGRRLGRWAAWQAAPVPTGQPQTATA
jgi:hypothetical protein